MALYNLSANSPVIVSGARSTIQSKTMRHIKQVISDSCIYGGLIQILHHTLMSGGVFESAPLFIFKEENNG